MSLLEHVDERGTPSRPFLLYLKGTNEVIGIQSCENVMAENHWVGVPFSSPSLVVLCHKLPEEMAGLAN